MILAEGLWIAPGLWCYPSPAVSGNYRIESGSLGQRGATLSTDRAHGVVVLGGYCRLDVGPSSRIRPEGRRWAEGIYLEEGSVTAWWIGISERLRCEPTSELCSSRARGLPSESLRMKEIARCSPNGWL